MAHSRRQPLHVYLTGKSQHEVNSSERHLRPNIHASINIGVRGLFAASKGGASIAREMHDAIDDLEARVHSTGKSEL